MSWTQRANGFPQCLRPCRSVEPPSGQTLPAGISLWIGFKNGD
jgi:hypothetical protein